MSNFKAQIKDMAIKLMPEPGDYTYKILPHLHIHRRDAPENNQCTFYSHALTLMIQGHKRLLIGREEFNYKEGQCLIVGVDVPSLGFITEASPESPCMTMAIDIDMYMINQMAADTAPFQKHYQAPLAVTTIDAEEDLLSAMLRLLKLLDKPESIHVMGPLITKEIYYHLLTSPIGMQLLQISTQGTKSHQITQTIEWLKKNFKQTIYVNKLANEAAMAPSTFHRHFKDMTALSPVQYQKRLRLYEAQRLIVFENVGVDKASYEVGYESTTQFIKEYKRMFGMPPLKDAYRLRKSPW